MSVTYPMFIPRDPWAALDGRLGAPAGAAQFPTLLNTYHPVGPPDGRSRSNGYQPPWLCAGVDYAVGVTPGTVFKDPNVDTLAGVSFSTGTKVATISGNNVTLDAWNMEGWQAEVTGDDATISNCKFKVTAFNEHCPIHALPANNNVTVTRCTFDGNAQDTSTGPIINFTGTGLLDMTYCHLHDAVGDFFNLARTISTDHLSGRIKFNLIVNNGMSVSHPDYMQLGTGTFDSIIIQFNTTVQDASVSGTQGFIIHTSNGSVGPSNISNNTMIAKNATATPFQMSRFVEWGASASGTNTCTNNYVDFSEAAQFSIVTSAVVTFGGNVDMGDGEVFGEEPADLG